jgi:hypothetical protein
MRQFCAPLCIVSEYFVFKNLFKSVTSILYFSYLQADLYGLSCNSLFLCYCVRKLKCVLLLMHTDACVYEINSVT